MVKAIRLKRVSREQSRTHRIHFRGITGQKRTGAVFMNSGFIHTAPIATAEGHPFVYPFNSRLLLFGKHQKALTRFANSKLGVTCCVGGNRRSSFRMVHEKSGFFEPVHI